MHISEISFESEQSAMLITVNMKEIVYRTSEQLIDLLQQQDVAKLLFSRCNQNDGFGRIDSFLIKTANKRTKYTLNKRSSHCAS